MAESEQSQGSSLSTPQILAVIFLLILSLLGAGIAFLHMRNNIYSPFVINPPQQNTESQKLEQFFNDGEKIQKRRDSDNDGLNDYQELNVYNTSPYLKDTDSDGIKDKQEVEQGTDPTCPKGESCKSDRTDSPENNNENLLGVVSSKEKKASNLNTSSNSNNLTASKSSSNNEPDNLQKTPKLAVKKLLQNPERLRELLKQKGSVPKDRLKKLSDQDLVLLMNKMLKKRGVNIGNVSSSTNVVGQTTTNTSTK
jgi:hypothetical protein